MGEYPPGSPGETAYLIETVNFIQSEINSARQILAQSKDNLIAARQDMWENTVHFSNDFDRLTEINQYLSELNNRTLDYSIIKQQLEKYQKVINSPYFARMDIMETGALHQEKIYIGLTNIMDRQTHDVYVYDWRTPIASLFYRFELGKGFYAAPAGNIDCEIFLKRQYKINHSKLEYYFDCSIAINDEMLQELLTRNASPKMRNIVETIQKEQDIIIRDVDNELLIVQGVAGSGKTSIALHRIAFLLYHGLGTNLTSANFLILSPNAVFSSYISTVLPELGEENVAQTTFDEIAAKHFAVRFSTEGRYEQLEDLISSPASDVLDLKRQMIEFKGSRTFAKLIDKFITYYARHFIPFEDVYFNSITVETKQQLKNRFLKNEIGIPMAKQLQRIENMLLNKVHPLQKDRLARLEQIVQKSEGHELEVKSFSRLLAIKESKRFMQQLQKFTTVDYLTMYKTLFGDEDLFVRLSQGLDVPKNITEIIAATNRTLAKGQISYADCSPLMYLKLKVEGSDAYPDITQVFIDEAQDYSPLQYEIFKLLFKQARFTVLGDINQSIGKDTTLFLYDEIEQILAKDKSLKISLNTSYRCSSEIIEFVQRILGTEQPAVPFERHEAKPKVVHEKDRTELDRQIAADIDHFQSQGYKSIAIICKTQQEANSLYSRLNDLIRINLLDCNDSTTDKDVLVIPSYLAKGLEFDVVLVYDVNIKNYYSESDRKLLYVACSRALHRLALYYTGKISPLIHYQSDNV